MAGRGGGRCTSDEHLRTFSYTCVYVCIGMSVYLGTCVCVIIIIFFCLVFFVFFAISWAAPAAYGGSQVRGLIGAIAPVLRQEPQQLGIRAMSATYTTAHSNAGSLTH